MVWSASTRSCHATRICQTHEWRVVDDYECLYCTFTPANKSYYRYEIHLSKAGESLGGNRQCMQMVVGEKSSPVSVSCRERTIPDPSRLVVGGHCCPGMAI